MSIGCQLFFPIPLELGLRHCLLFPFYSKVFSSTLLRLPLSILLHLFYLFPRIVVEIICSSFMYLFSNLGLILMFLIHAHSVGLYIISCPRLKTKVLILDLSYHGGGSILVAMTIEVSMILHLAIASGFMSMQSMTLHSQCT